VENRLLQAGDVKEKTELRGNWRRPPVGHSPRWFKTESRKVPGRGTGNLERARRNNQSDLRGNRGEGAPRGKKCPVIHWVNLRIRKGDGDDL